MALALLGQIAFVNVILSPEIVALGRESSHGANGNPIANRDAPSDRHLFLEHLKDWFLLLSSYSFNVVPDAHLSFIGKPTS